VACCRSAGRPFKKISGANRDAAQKTIVTS
jgi:hypothetical protein